MAKHARGQGEEADNNASLADGRKTGLRYLRKEMINVNFSAFHILLNNKDAPTV